ncbi:MAG: hypothetical protein FWC13_04015 [Oscillospiraceae bacterium]|nr:hypothetical protein [Oscillospiraceae bacterium]
MGIEYYVFALFIAALVCIVALVFKVLFSNVKRQQRMLDERETQILHLYNTIETIMEEFSDQVKVSMDEIKALEYRATSQIAAFQLPPELERKEQVLDKVQIPRTEPLTANRIRAAGEVLDRAERIIKHDLIVNEEVAIPQQEPPAQNAGVFQKFFDDAADGPPQEFELKNGTPSRNDQIMALAKEGKTDVEIASKLGITRNEVQLITRLTR